MLRKVISGTEKLPPSLILKKLIGINILSLMVRPSLSRLSLRKRRKWEAICTFLSTFLSKVTFQQRMQHLRDIDANLTNTDLQS